MPAQKTPVTRTATATIGPREVSRKGFRRDLGELLGVKNFSIYTYEKGRSEPNIDGLIALADFFDVSIDYLVGPGGPSR